LLDGKRPLIGRDLDADVKTADEAVDQPTDHPQLCLFNQLDVGEHERNGVVESG
jgi:hypothetical protein